MDIRNSEGYMDFVPYKAISNIDREMKAVPNAAFRPLVYICAPFSGAIERNKKRATEFATFAYKNGCIPMTPHLLFPFMDDRKAEERTTVLHMDMVLMGKCKEVWVLSENGITPGMHKEIKKAASWGKNIRYFNNDFTEVECL